MGGYGALKLAIKHPTLYASATSHSGAPDTARWVPNEDAGELGLIFGKHAAGGPNDLFALAERAREHDLPALRLDCGTGDFLLEQNRLFHRHLDALKIRHEYEEFPGEHSWDYWDLRVQEALAFHMRVLNPA